MNALFEAEAANDKKSYETALHTSNSNDWYTPHIYAKAAKSVMGSIELDPASSHFANKIIQARRYYTIEDDGLKQEWRARSLWLNPPYGRGNLRNQGHVQIWIDKLISEYKKGSVQEALLLVNALTDRRWFDSLWEYPICFIKTRISFINPSQLNKQEGRPPHANTIVYLGPNESRFIDVFSQFGRIVRAIDVPKPKPVALELWNIAWPSQ